MDIDETTLKFNPNKSCHSLQSLNPMTEDLSSKAKAAQTRAALTCFLFSYSYSLSSFSDCFHLSRSPSVVLPALALEEEPLPLP